ncbi:MAG: hypothetical protein WA624_21435, partial [Methylocella sp.]
MNGVLPRFWRCMMIVPTYLPYYVITGGIGIVAAILFGLNSALSKSDWTASDRASVARTSSIVLIGWFLVATSLAWIDAYRATADRIPTIQYGIFVPILIGGLLIWRSSTVARIIDAVPQQWLIGVQLYRVLYQVSESLTPEADSRIGIYLIHHGKQLLGEFA